MIEAELTALLKADVTVSAVVGTRVFPMVIPEKELLPAIVYQRVSSVPTTSNDGDSGLDAVRIQIRSWADSYLTARQLADAVRAAINASTLKSILVSDFDDRDPETRCFSIVADYRIWQQ